MNGYHGDCSDMFEVEECDSNVRQLINVTKLCLKSAINICKPNENLCNIGNQYNNQSTKKNCYLLLYNFQVILLKRLQTRMDIL